MTTEAALETLLDNHRAFLRYLERRVGDRAQAEDMLQEAFVRNLGRLHDLPDEALVPWFFRTLRNAVVDYHRRTGAAGRALDAFARELERMDVPDAELRDEICTCIARLADTLKPEYGEILRTVEIDGLPVKAFAERHGLSPGNAAVRVHRARAALRRRVTESCGVCAEHGCRHCTCGGARRPPGV